MAQDDTHQTGLDVIPKPSIIDLVLYRSVKEYVTELVGDINRRREKGVDILPRIRFRGLKNVDDLTGESDSNSSPPRSFSSSFPGKRSPITRSFNLKSIARATSTRMTHTHGITFGPQFGVFRPCE